MKEFSYEEVSSIVKNSKIDIACNRNYQMFHKRFLQELWDDEEVRLKRHVLYAIAISPDELEKIEFASLQDNLRDSVGNKAENNYLEIDHKGKIIGCDYIEGDTPTLKNKLQELSGSKYVFFFGDSGITAYVHGSTLEEKNIFYSQSDRLRYIEKKDISQIKEVMDAYEKDRLLKKSVYMHFFVDDAIIRKIDPNLIGKNVLRNRPERYMRDDLCDYLSEHMRYTFTTEPQLPQTEKRFDISFDVCGELYFIEIKWLGRSIKDDGTAISTEFKDSRARAGVTQILEYIEELLNSTGRNSLRHGYLVVYDARDDHKKINFQDFGFVKKELRKYLEYFDVLKVLQLDKI